MKTAKLNKGINAVKNVANNRGGRFHAAIVNGNHMNDSEMVANVNNATTNLNINAEVANCEVSESNTSHFKMSISLPWGGEAKLEWNGSSTISSSVLAKEKCAEIAKERQERALNNIKDIIEGAIGRTVKFIQEDMPQIKDAIEALKDETPELSIDEKVKENYECLDPSWRRSFEQCLKDQDNESACDYDIKEDEAWIAAQAKAVNLGILNEVQIHLLYKSGLIIDKDEQTEDEFDTVK